MGYVATSWGDLPHAVSASHQGLCVELQVGWALLFPVIAGHCWPRAPIPCGGIAFERGYGCAKERDSIETVDLASDKDVSSYGDGDRIAALARSGREYFASISECTPILCQRHGSFAGLRVAACCCRLLNRLDLAMPSPHRREYWPLGARTETRRFLLRPGAMTRPLAVTRYYLCHRIPQQQ